MPELRRPSPKAFPNAGQESELVPGADVLPRQPAVDDPVPVQEKGVRIRCQNRIRRFQNRLDLRKFPLRTGIVFRNADVDEIPFLHLARDQAVIRQGLQDFPFEREGFREQGHVQLRAVDGIDAAVDQTFGTGLFLPESGDQVAIPFHRAVAVEIPHRLQRQGHGGGKRKRSQIDVVEGVSVQDEHLLFLAFLQGQADAATGAHGFLLHGETDGEGPFP